MVTVENDMTEVGCADFVDLGVGQHPAHVGAVLGFVNGSEFVAQVAGGAVDCGGEELSDGDRHSGERSVESKRDLRDSLRF
jgi:hypothetical protein